MENHLFASQNFDIVLVQPIDKADLAYMEEEIELIKKLSNGKDFSLLAVVTEDWNKELSPWNAPAVFGKEDFGSGAKQTLEYIQNTLEKFKDKRLFIGGYSLAGLFSLWAVYNTDIFSGVAGVSPSVWFNGFTDYVKQNDILTKNVYLSLGNTEEKTKNPTMKTVGTAINEIYLHLKNKEINCLFELNEGNHFKEPFLRTAKGFAYLLKNR